eukprot:SAG11_NODE_495_length_8943_cov_274.008028_7_plen_109_part_00
MLELNCLRLCLCSCVHFSFPKRLCRRPSELGRGSYSNIGFRVLDSFGFFLISVEVGCAVGVNYPPPFDQRDGVVDPRTAISPDSIHLDLTALYRSYGAIAQNWLQRFG